MDAVWWALMSVTMSGVGRVALGQLHEAYTRESSLRSEAKSQQMNSQIPAALAELAALAVAADGVVTEHEWRALGEALLTQGLPLNREQAMACLRVPLMALREPQVLEREVRTLAGRLGPEGCELGYAMVASLARSGSGQHAGGDYRAGERSDSALLLANFATWLGVDEFGLVARPAR
ncbi:MAG: hypothetical protein Q8Q09_16020 [Deltaproteobacteria bacterium]|nr:hypothetical protein [Deltaproteobacteria bacterium]